MLSLRLLKVNSCSISIESSYLSYGIRLDSSNSGFRRRTLSRINANYFMADSMPKIQHTSLARFVLPKNTARWRHHAAYSNWEYLMIPGAILDPDQEAQAPPVSVQIPYQSLLKLKRTFLHNDLLDLGSSPLEFPGLNLSCTAFTHFHFELLNSALCKCQSFYKTILTAVNQSIFAVRFCDIGVRWIRDTGVGCIRLRLTLARD
jgi:hypothetical protein